MTTYARILGTGSSAPDQVLTNADLEKMVDTSDEWITTRTGIKERRIAPAGKVGTDYAYAAALKAMEMAETTADKLDLILFGTVTPDAPLPSNACALQKMLGASNAAALDVVAACSGFIYGLSLARSMIMSGQARRALVIGCEMLTRITNWKDRNTCVLFGDGAGAAIVGASDKPGGILETYIRADGNLAHLLQITTGGTKIPVTPANVDSPDRMIHMEGRAIFKYAVRAMGEAAAKVLKMGNVNSKDISLLIPHQANIRIIEATAKRIKLPMDRVYINIHKYGNTSSASIPIALDEAVREGRIKKGQKFVLVAFGAGFTWGSALVEW